MRLGARAALLILCMCAAAVQGEVVLAAAGSRASGRYVECKVSADLVMNPAPLEPSYGGGAPYYGVIEELAAVPVPDGAFIDSQGVTDASGATPSADALPNETWKLVYKGRPNATYSSFGLVPFKDPFGVVLEVTGTSSAPTETPSWHWTVIYELNDASSCPSGGTGGPQPVPVGKVSAPPSPAAGAAGATPARTTPAPTTTRASSSGSGQLTVTLPAPAAGAKATYEVIPPSGVDLISLTSPGLRCTVKDGDGSCSGPAAKSVKLDVKTSPALDTGAYSDWLVSLQTNTGVNLCYRLDDAVATQTTCPAKETPELQTARARILVGEAVTSLTTLDHDLAREVSYARSGHLGINVQGDNHELLSAMNDVWEAVTELHPHVWGCSDIGISKLFEYLAEAEGELDNGSVETFYLDEAEKEVAACPSAPASVLAALVSADALATSAEKTVNQGGTVDPATLAELKQKVVQLTALLPRLFGIDSDVIVSQMGHFLAYWSKADSEGRAQRIDQDITVQNIADVEAMIRYKQAIENGLRSVAGSG